MNALRNILVWSLIVSAFSVVQAQSPSAKLDAPASVWKTLTSVEFKKDPDGEYLPVFSQPIKALAGKQIELTGYFIPIEEGRNQTHFLFSSLPASSCYFCGSGGPESVAEVYCKMPIRYTDKRIRLLGTLSLNATDPEKLMYILNDASLVVE